MGAFDHPRAQASLVRQPRPACFNPNHSKPQPAQTRLVLLGTVYQTSREMQRIDVSNGKGEGNGEIYSGARSCLLMKISPRSVIVQTAVTPDATLDPARTEDWLLVRESGASKAIAVSRRQSVYQIILQFASEGGGVWPSSVVAKAHHNSAKYS